MNTDNTIKNELLSALEEISKKVNKDQPEHLNQKDLRILFISSLLEEVNK